jgi:hypothetical protein
MKRLLLALLGGTVLAGSAFAVEDTSSNIIVPIDGSDTAVMGTTYVGSRHIAHHIPHNSGGTELMTQTNPGGVRLSDGSNWLSSLGVAGDVAHDAADSGNPVKIGAKYVATTTTVADGDRANLVTDSHQNLRVVLWSPNTASGITAATSGLSAVTASAASLRVLSPNYLSNGSTLDVALSGNGAVANGVQRVTIANDSTGVLASVGSITTSIVPGGGATHLGKARDGAVGATDTGVMALGIIDTSLSSLSFSDGDYDSFRLSSRGALWVDNEAMGLTTDTRNTSIDTTAATAIGLLKQNNYFGGRADNSVTTLAAGTATTNVVNIGCQYRASLPTATDTQSLGVQCSAGGKLLVEATGPAESDAVSTTTLSPIAIEARSTSKTAVSSADFTRPIGTLDGRQVVMPYDIPENYVSGTTASMTGTTSTSLVASPGASLRNYITNITCSNSHATVGTNVLVQDGSGGTTLFVIPAAALYGGAVVTFPFPLRQPTTATALYVQNEVTASAVKCSANGFKAA